MLPLPFHEYNAGCAIAARGTNLKISAATSTSAIPDTAAAALSKPWFAAANSALSIWTKLIDQNTAAAAAASAAITRGTNSIIATLAAITYGNLHLVKAKYWKDMPTPAIRAQDLIDDGRSRLPIDAVCTA